MSSNAAKAIASIIVSTMSFLGWNTPDYSQYLPKQIQSQIIFVPPIAERLPITPKAPTKDTSPNPKGPAKPTLKPTMPPTPSPTSTTEPITPPQKTQAPIESLSTEERIKRSTVNILCSMQRGGLIAKYTGSGVIIDPSGVIITDAHVAEHIMLAEAGFETCQIRTGSPAKNTYRAKVIYLPDIWIQNNKNNLAFQTISNATSEHDYALLLITELTVRDAPNVPLVYLPLSSNVASKGDPITLAGYPASFGNTNLLDSSLYFLGKPSQITNVSGFNGRDADVINSAPTTLAEYGSSGGAIVGADGSLVGIIDSIVVDNFSGQKAIQGISISYIKKSILENSSKSFESFIVNAKDEADNFEKNKAPSLSTLLMR